ncbi:uncharacterized protein LOC111400380 [Olea europaea var. sylvestris]|uniref:uncharacterized protein LOC111400380 n=1 Tax=Olea europaea var. sylvestris TaxID=158386 RepID=UPI000C1D7F4E|nr:uncharacterized protein LOC111400380 [Olea europaea var. sylvestris]
MCGTWNGLQALFLNECPYAYYIHCSTHRLQLTLVSAAKDVICIWKFFSHLDNIVNFITSSPKHINALQTAQRRELEDMLASGERQSGSRINQIDMYAATCKVLEYLIVHSLNGRSRAEAHGVYETIKSFEFVFSLHLKHKILGFNDILCQALPKRSQDIPTAIKFVSTTKGLLQEFREDGWEEFLNAVKTLCLRNDADIPDLNSFYKIYRPREEVTLEGHYHFNVFNEAIDFQMMELNTRFNELSVELLSLTVALDPRNSFESFNGDDIFKLAEKFYPCDFSQQELHSLRRSENYIVLTKLIRLVLTLPVSIATTERAFSAVKHVKTAIHNRMEDEFFADCMMLYIEREFAEKIDVDSIIDKFYAVKA